MPFVLVDAFGQAFVVVGELRVIDAEEVEDRRVDRVDVQTVLDSVEAEVFIMTWSLVLPEPAWTKG